MKWLDNCLLTLAIIGCIVWGLIGFFQFNLVSFLFGDGTWLTRIIYALVGLSGLYIISFYGRIRSSMEDQPRKSTAGQQLGQRYFCLFICYFIYFFFNSLLNQCSNLMRLHILIFIIINRIQIVHIGCNRTTVKTVKYLIRIN